MERLLEENILINENDIEEEEIISYKRLKGEPIEAYRYFCIYRDMGPGRSYHKTAEAANVTYQTIALRGSQFHWRKRVKYWQDEVDRNRREAYLNEIKEMAKRHAQQSMAYQKVLIMPVEAILKKMKVNDPSYIDFQNLPVEVLFDKSLKSAQLMSSVVDIERKSRGEPSEIIKQEIQQTNNNEIKVVLPAIPDHLKYLVDENNINANNIDNVKKLDEESSTAGA